MKFLRQVSAIIEKDIVAELRTKENFTAMVVFSTLVVIIFNFAFQLQGVDIKVFGSGILWVAFTFSGILGLGRSFAAEKDKGSLEGLLLTPMDRGALFLGKAAANFLFISVMEAITLFMLVILNNVSIHLFPLVPFIILGTIGFAGMGTLISSIAANTRMSEVMLPILHFPVSIPLLMASVNLTTGAFQGVAFDELTSWFTILVTYDVIFTVVAFLVFEYVVEE